MNIEEFDDLAQEFDEDDGELFPEVYYQWDDALSANLTPPYIEEDDLLMIINLYLDDGDLEKARKTIDYTFRFYPSDMELLADVLMSLNECELWNDIIDLVEQYDSMPDIWVDCHKISALLHLGLEEEAYTWFILRKELYRIEEDDYALLYQAMCEALTDVDLFESAIAILNEARQIFGNSEELEWLNLQIDISKEDKDSAMKTAARIEKMNPLDGLTWHNLGRIYANDLDAPENAIDAFEFAESLDFREQPNYLYLICMYEKCEYYLKALDKIKEYESRFDENLMLQVLAISICTELGMWNESLNYVNRAINRAPEISSLYICKSDILQSLGETQKARSVLEEGIRQTADNGGELKKKLKNLLKLYPDK